MQSAACSVASAQFSMCSKMRDHTITRMVFSQSVVCKSRMTCINSWSASSS